jgi:hypothetical protein
MRELAVRLAARVPQATPRLMEAAVRVPANGSGGPRDSQRRWRGYRRMKGDFR